MSRLSRKVLIAGATGMIGSYFRRHAATLEGWQTLGVSRTRPEGVSEQGWIAVDLLDQDATIAAFHICADVTDVLYAGYVHGNGWQTETEANTALLRNTVEGLRAAGARLNRIVLIQGQKYYGSHLGPFKTPSREDDARHAPPNFYYNQQDFLAQAQRGEECSWTCLRPHVVGGITSGSPLNIMSVIAAYATITRELGLPLGFPGSKKAYSAVYQATDATLLCQAIQWAIESPQCQNQAFNITNGDVFRWESLWPKLAAHFRMGVEAPQDVRLQKVMTDKGPLWDAICVRHGLRQMPLDQFVNWAFGDYVFHTEWDVMASTIKSRQHGFSECTDTENMFISILKRMAECNFIPR